MQKNVTATPKSTDVINVRKKVFKTLKTRFYEKITTFVNVNKNMNKKVTLFILVFDVLTESLTLIRCCFEATAQRRYTNPYIIMFE